MNFWAASTLLVNSTTVPKTSRFTGFPLFHPSWTASLLLSAWLAGGCGGDDGPPPVVLPDASDEDTGVDAGVDAGEDAQVTDFVLTGPCLADEANVQTFTPREENAQAAPSLSAERLSYGLVYAEQTDCSDAIVLQDMASNELAAERRVLLDECSAMRNAVGVPVGSNWLLAWLDGRNSGFQVMTAHIDPSATPPMTPPARTALTSTPDVKGALVLALAADEQSALLAWTETSAAGDSSAIKVRALDANTGAPSADTVTLQAEAGQLYTALAIATIPTGGAVLGYVAGAGQVRSIFLQQLAADGTAVGQPALLSDAGDPSATVSIAMKDEATDRGAAVYSVNPAGTRPGVRFQALDASGQPSGQYRVLSGNLERANGIGIVTTLSGFAVAYRAITDFNWDIARIRMSFLNDVGNRTGDGVTDVIESSDFGGAPALTIALDGRVALAWFDDDEGGNRTLKLVNYPCNR